MLPIITITPCQDRHAIVNISAVKYHLNTSPDVRVGRNLVRAVLDYYQFLGLIPHELPDALPLHDLPRRRPDPPCPESQVTTH